MSEENVERVLAAGELFNRLGASLESADPSDFGRFLGFMAPDIQFEPQQALLEGSYEGLGGVGEWLGDVTELYVRGGVQFTDVRDLGDRVLALGTLRVTGSGSGIEVEVPLALLVRFRDGLITHLNDYGDRDKALEAAGLSE